MKRVQSTIAIYWTGRDMYTLEEGVKNGQLTSVSKSIANQERDQLSEHMLCGSRKE